MTHQLHALTALLARSRRRQLLQLGLEQAGLALGAAFAGTIILLLLGTQILDWYWLVVLFAATFGFGMWRTARLTPSRYGLAQTIDSRLRLDDTLSTAFIYGSGGRAGKDESIEYECAQAERLARGVDARTVFPLRVPKAMYAVAGVALVAFGMFAIRYGVTHSLDLRPSLVRIAFDSVWNAGQTAPADKKSSFLKRLEEQLKKMGIDLGSPDTEQTLDGAPESALNTIDTPNVNNSDSNESTQARAANVKERQEPGDGEGAEKGDGSGGKEEPAAGDQPPQARSDSPGKQDGPQKDSNSQSGDKNSLMDRMRDAMANLLNKLNMQQKGGENQASRNSARKSGQENQAQGQKGAQGKPDANSSEGAEQQGQQPGEGQQSQSAQGKAGDKGAEKSSSDSKSGMGKDDGDKSAREAEQLAAMGKISEILGKRAQNLSGELMVEVAGGHQQLKTAYSSKVGAHSEAGGEITRDEVPMIYRDFVQQYFEQVRRAPAPAARSKAAAASAVKKPAKVTE